jgi:molybdopterin-containing oxidoreductase family iron-sulfur binding subunit
MVIDKRRCIGCNACAIACKQEHSTGPGVLYSRTIVSEKGTYPNARMDYLPLLCMHCENASCVKACPTGASMKLENGTVIVDADKCIGCQACVLACPYDSRTLVSKPKPYYEGKGYNEYEQAIFGKHQAGTVEKCNFCKDRVEEGRQPACVQTCPTRARIFGDLDDPKSEVSRLIVERNGKQLHPEHGNEPSVYYLPHTFDEIDY